MPKPEPKVRRYQAGFTKSVPTALPSYHNVAFLGYRMGDYVETSQNGHTGPYGKIVLWEPEQDILHLERPHRYTLTENGFLNKPSTTTVRTHTMGLTFYDSTREKILGQIPLNPFIDYLDKLVTLSGNSPTQFGVLTNVHPDTVVLQPHIIRDIFTGEYSVSEARLIEPSERVHASPACADSINNLVLKLEEDRREKEAKEQK